MFNIELPEVFTGDDGQDFRQWVRRFEVAVEMAPDAPSRIHVLLPSCLAGSALQVWESFSESRQKDFHEAKTILSAIFGRGNPNNFQISSNPTSQKHFDAHSKSEATFIKPDHSLSSQSPPDEEPRVAALRNEGEVLQQVLIRLEKLEEKVERLQHSQQPQLSPSSPPRHQAKRNAPSDRQVHQLGQHTPTNFQPPPATVSVITSMIPSSVSAGTQTNLEKTTHVKPSSLNERSSHLAKSFTSLELKILEHQKKDREIRKLKETVTDGLRFSPKEICEYHPRVRRYLWQLPRFCIKDDILYRTKMDRKKVNRFFQAVIPRTLIPEVLPLLHDHHSAEHLDINQTLEKAKSELFWPFMHQDILNFCKTCNLCHPNQSTSSGNQPSSWMRHSSYQPQEDFKDCRPKSLHPTSYLPRKKFKDGTSKKKSRTWKKPSDYQKKSKYTSKDIYSNVCMTSTVDDSSHFKSTLADDFSIVESPTEDDASNFTLHQSPYTYSNHPNFKTPHFSPHSSIHPPSWMNDQSTFNSDSFILSEISKAEYHPSSWKGGQGTINPGARLQTCTSSSYRLDTNPS